MGRYKIAVIPGDDAGPEAMEAALHVLDKALKNSSVNLDFIRADVGFKRFESTGDTLEQGGVKYGGISQAVLGKIEGAQALFYTAIAGSKFPRGVQTPWTLLMKHLKTNVNVRLGKSYPNTGALKPDIDMALVREQSEGMYTAPEFTLGEEIVCAVVQCSKSATRRIARMAFDLARSRNKPRKKVSVINKGTLKAFFTTFSKVTFEVAKEYPDVQCEEIQVDVVPYAMFKEPETFDVLLVTNMLGDVYSGAMAAVIGSLGIGPGALYGDDYAIFKPNHGTAPDIVGKNLINPTATILSGKMMLDWLAAKYKDDECRKVGEVIEEAIVRVLADGKVLTGDLGGNATTTRFTQEVLSKI